MGNSHKTLKDSCKYTIAICQYVMIPKPHHTITFVQNKSVPQFVIVTVGVLSTVDFHNKHFITANKVGNIRTDRYLPCKLKSAETPIAECKP